MVEALQVPDAGSYRETKEACLRRLESCPPLSVDGKFLHANDGRRWIKGVTYGTFASNLAAEPYPELEQIREDLPAIAEAGINTSACVCRPPTVARASLDAAPHYVPLDSIKTAREWHVSRLQRWVAVAG